MRVILWLLHTRWHTLPTHQSINQINKGERSFYEAGEGYLAVWQENVYLKFYNQQKYTIKNEGNIKPHYWTSKKFKSVFSSSSLEDSLQDVLRHKENGHK